MYVFKAAIRRISTEKRPKKRRVASSSKVDNVKAEKKPSTQDQSALGKSKKPASKVAAGDTKPKRKRVGSSEDEDDDDDSTGARVNKMARTAARVAASAPDDDTFLEAQIELQTLELELNRKRLALKRRQDQPSPAASAAKKIKLDPSASAAAAASSSGAAASPKPIAAANHKNLAKRHLEGTTTTQMQRAYLEKLQAKEWYIPSSDQEYPAARVRIIATGGHHFRHCLVMHNATGVDVVQNVGIIKATVRFAACVVLTV